ncbi:MAG TPA: hypothetical protein VHV83_13180, partial [Armatimonadota bacterium]|nr:hypothetical protein [Armatimonadota bacterium]
MADEKRPFESPEDLGESLAGHGKNTAAPGAGARKSEEATETEFEREGRHKRVITGAERSSRFATEGANETIGNAPPMEETAEDVSDEEFR